MNAVISRIIGLSNFKDAKQIIDFLAGKDTSQDFTQEKHIQFAETRDFKLWMVWSKTHVFVVRDNGQELKTLLKRKKADFHPNLINENMEPRLYINDTVTTLPITPSLTGSTGSFSNVMESNSAV